MGKQTVTFSLDTERDRDLVRWLARLPKRGKSEEIRAALRTYLGRGGVTLGDVYQAVKELERTLQGGAFVGGITQEGDTPDEPPDAAAALDKLGL